MQLQTQDFPLSNSLAFPLPDVHGEWGGGLSPLQFYGSVLCREFGAALLGLQPWPSLGVRLCCSVIL